MVGIREALCGFALIEATGVDAMITKVVEAEGSVQPTSWVGGDGNKRS